MKRVMTFLLAVTMLLSVVAVLSGCGDSENGTTSPSTTAKKPSQPSGSSTAAPNPEPSVNVNPSISATEDQPPASTPETEPPQPQSTSVPLLDLEILTDEASVGERNYTDSYGNEHEGPYIDLCSYGDGPGDDYITQSYMEFYNAGEFRYLTGTYFTRDKQSDDFTIELMIYADDELVYCSEPISRKAKAIDFAVDIGNCDVIRIISRSYDHTSLGTNPGIILVDAMVHTEYDGALTPGVYVDPNLVPLTDLHVFSKDAYITAGPVSNAYGNVYKGIYVELVSYESFGDLHEGSVEFVNDGYRYLSGTIFTREKQSDSFTIEFFVYADDELVYSSGPISRSTKSVDFMVEVGDCDLIRVVSRSYDYTSTGTNPGIILVDAFVSVEKP